MSQHKHGMFVSRAAKMAASLKQIADKNVPSASRQNQCRPPVIEPLQQNVGTVDVLQWVYETPCTMRIVRKREWRNLQGLFLDAMRGYRNATADETGRVQQERQELLLSNLVRSNLRQKQAPPDSGVALPQTDDKKRLAKKVLLQLELGALGKAARTLAAPPASMITPSADLLEKLKELFPTEVTPSQARERVPFRVLQLNSSLIQDAVMKRMSRAAAPGPDGWTRELLIPLVADKDCLLELTALIRKMLSDECSSTFKARTLSTLLCPIAKPDGGVRPICPESALLKLASIVAMRMLTRDEIEKAVSSSQFGVGGSAVVAAKRCRKLLSTLPFAVALDAKNAFNCVSRAAILKEVFENESLRAIRGIVHFSLDGSTPICLRSRECFPCTSGVRQGSVLGPLLFSSAIREAITAVESTGCSVVAYLDDMTLFASSAEILQQGIAAAECAFRAVRLQLNPKKCVTLHRDDDHFVTTIGSQAAHQSRGPTKILGAFCGPGDYAAPLLLRVKEKYAHFFGNVQDTPLPISAKLAILRSSACCAMTFLLQTHEEAATKNAISFFDSSVFETFRRVTNTTDEESFQRTETIMHLPTSFGGLGFPSQASIAKAATIAATSPISHKTAMQTTNEATHAELLSSLSGPETAVLRSSGSWIADTQAMMSDRATLVACRIRLLLPIRTGSCKCGKHAATNDHVQTCTSVSKTDRHNAVVNTLARKLRDVNLTVTVEPSAMGTDSRARPDISVTASTPFGAGLITFATDVVVCHAATSKTLTGVKDAATLAADTKKQRWGEWARKTNVKFEAGVVTSTGSVTSNFKKWIYEVLSCSSLIGGEIQEKAHEINIALGIATMEATEKMFSFVC